MNNSGISAVLLLALSFSTATLAVAQDAKKTIKKVSITSTSMASGEEMFSTYCAVCHGKGGKGDGPASSEFKIPPANLTHLALNNSGKFPEAHIAQVIEFGPQEAKAHGSKDMPVWGTLFASLDSTSNIKGALVHQRIYNLTKYIESLQTN
jgi:mono/diheme cytochrome c family protein